MIFTTSHPSKLSESIIRGGSANKYLRLRPSSPGPTEAALTANSPRFRVHVFHDFRRGRML